MTEQVFTANQIKARLDVAAALYQVCELDAELTFVYECALGSRIDIARAYVNWCVNDREVSHKYWFDEIRPLLDLI